MNYITVLVNKLRLKDETTILEVYDLYAPKLFSYISQILPTQRIAEQALQTTLLKALLEINRFNENRDDFYIWLLNIARNESIELLIHNESKQLALLTNVTCPNSLQVNKFIEKLDTCEKAIFSLMYYRRFSFEKVADILRIPASLTKAKMKSAYKKLEQQYAEPGIKFVPERAAQMQVA